jgi:chloramphenicol 3-O-phosphotransferase
MSGVARGPIVVVSGLPAAGKSTLAARLRDELGLPLLSLDTVKEAIVDGMGADVPADRFVVRRAARDIVVALAAANPQGCLIDIWINPGRDESGFADGLRAIEDARFVEVLCRVPVEIALERYAGRHRHPAHLPMDDATRRRIEDAAPLIGPLGLGPHIDVDTVVPVAGERWETLVSWLVGHGFVHEVVGQC